MITYKCKKLGLEVVFIDERLTSQTCPKCGCIHKSDSRIYCCPDCGFTYHRDGMAALNIRQRYLYQECASVVGDMAPPVGLHCIVRSGKSA